MPAVGLTLIALSRLFWIAQSPLQPDEAYYWEWSRRLDLGYFDHPPLVALVIHLTTAFGGAMEWAVRVGMVVLGVGTAALIYHSATALGGRSAGGIALAIVAVCPVFVLPATFASPDGPLLFLWAATVAALVEALRGQGPWWWCIGGVVLGLALLDKYTAILLVPSIGLFLLMSRSGWRRRAQPYLAAALALLVASPNLWWEAHHRWVGLSFQASHAACLAGLDQSGALAQAGVYFATQANLVSPPLALLLAGGTLAALAQGRRPGQDAHLLLACCTVTTVVVFLLVHGARHWTAPAYVSAAVCAAWWLAEMLRHATMPWRRMGLIGLALALACGVLEATVLEGTYVTHTLNGATAGPLDPLVNRIMPSLLAAAPDWRALGHAVAAGEGVAHVGAQPATVWAATYGLAAEVAFYTPLHPRVYSGSGEYRLWGPSSDAPGPTLFVGPDGLLAPPEGPAQRGEHVVARLDDRAGGLTVGPITVTMLPRLPQHAARAQAAALLARTTMGGWRAATCLPAQAGS